VSNLTYNYENKSFNPKISLKIDQLRKYFYCFEHLDGKQLLTETLKLSVFCLMNMQNIIINNNHQSVFDNEANMSENMTSHNNADDGNFGWSSDEFQ